MVKIKKHNLKFLEKGMKAMFVKAGVEISAYN